MNKLLESGDLQINCMNRMIFNLRYLIRHYKNTSIKLK